MSGNNYLNNPYNQYTANNYPPNQSWPNWTYESQQYAAENYQRSTGTTSYPNQINHVPPTDPRPPNNYAASSRSYNQRRYNVPPPPLPYSTTSPQPWQQRYYNKRTNSDSPDDLRYKPNKKKKKPLSQNIPSKKDWTIEDAERALNIEKEFNKRNKNMSLIVKFPDLELNKEIVSSFHPDIESVHFQQPSTPRFCFIVLKENTNAEKVIERLNKIPFGDGFLTAEYKKDREEEQNIGPEDIDPLTLYVGNLAQEVTKEDMIKAYPKQKRIDIGYAKKMKYTRYAFVSFKNVNDAIDAFKNTHATEMYSKSLIVRFRRLHGTVGMPGEPKPQNQPKNKDESITNEPVAGNTSLIKSPQSQSTNGETDLTNTDSIPVNLNLVKTEPGLEDDSEGSSFSTPFFEGSLELAFAMHRPKVKQEIKREVEDDAPFPPVFPIKVKEEPVENPQTTHIKKEREEKDLPVENEEDDDRGGLDFRSILDTMEDRANRVTSLRNIVP